VPYAGVQVLVVGGLHQQSLPLLCKVVDELGQHVAQHGSPLHQRPAGKWRIWMLLVPGRETRRQGFTVAAQFSAAAPSWPPRCAACTLSSPTASRRRGTEGAYARCPADETSTCGRWCDCDARPFFFGGNGGLSRPSYPLRSTRQPNILDASSSLKHSSPSLTALTAYTRSSTLTLMRGIDGWGASTRHHATEC
jgi:hypothetical protein